MAEKTNRKRVSTPILKPTDDQKPETFFGLIYHPLFSSSDKAMLQNDLDIMTQWCVTNTIKLNSTKIKVMRPWLSCLYTLLSQVVDEIK